MCVYVRDREKERDLYISLLIWAQVMIPGSWDGTLCQLHPVHEACLGFCLSPSLSLCPLPHSCSLARALSLSTYNTISYVGILFSVTREGSAALCNNIDEPGEHYAK